MLKSIDVLIGLVVILLALSMAVTVITQTLTTIFNSRGKHLKRGLTDLLAQLDPALAKADVSAAIATTVLEHPLVSGSSMPFGGGKEWWRRFLGGARLGNVIHRDEFTKLLMGIASGSTATLNDDAKAALKTALANNGVTDPDGTLRAIRSIALQLEKTSPELSTAARQTAAVLHASATDFVAKVNGWFDQTMDRTSQRFTASTRVITFVGAFVVAFGLQVDTPLLYNRLQADDVLREELVKQAQTLHEQRPTSAQTNPAAPAAPVTTPAPNPAATGDQTTTPAPPPGTTTPTNPPAGEQSAAKPAPDDFNSKYRDFLSEAGIIKLPSTTDWAKCYDEGSLTSCFAGKTFGGMLITALLLSLGAPFWYSALGNLLQLRSLLAAKDDAQRKERQTDTSPAGSATPTKGPSPPAAGERGDLGAVG